MPKNFCKEYKKVFAMLQEEGIFSPDKIPQLEEMSNFLKSKYLDYESTFNSLLQWER